MRPSDHKGSLLIDTLLAVVIFGAVIAAFSTGIIEGSRGTKSSGDRVRAVYMAEEGVGAIRSIRNSSGGFALILSQSLNTNLGVELSGTGSWSITSNPNIIDSIFTRTIQFSNPNANDDDRLVTSTITWNNINGEEKSVATSTFVTNWRVTIPLPDWTNPTLTGSVAGPSDATMEKIEVSGNYAFVAESKNGTLLIFDVSDLTNPTLVQTVTAVGPAYDLAISGDYLYLATDEANKELKILDISDPPNTSCCTREINFTSNAEIKGISITGTGLFIARQYNNSAEAGELYILDIGDDPSLATISSPPIISDAAVETVFESDNTDKYSMYAVTAAGSAKEPHAYLATNFTTQELAVISMTGSNITGGGDAEENTRGTAVAVFSTGAYVGVVGNGAWEVYAYDISSVSNPVLGDVSNAKYDLGGDSDSSEAANDFAISRLHGFLFMATNTQRSSINHYLHILDMRNVHNINSGRVIYDGPITDGYFVDKGIYYRESDHRVFMVGGDEDDGSHLLIIEPTYP